MENGTFVHRESQTYRRKVLANEWLRRREYEMDQERASCQAVHKKISVGEPLRDYVSAAENVTEWGRSKKADIARLQASGLADLQATKLTVQDLMGDTKKRRTEDEAGPATVLNDMVWLRQVFLHASAARGVDVPLQVLDRAKSGLLRTRVIAKPAQRSRRLLPEEEARLLEHFASRDGRASSTGRGTAGRPTTTTAPGAAPPAIPGWTKGLRPPRARKPRSWPRICARSWHGARWPTPRTSMPATEPLCCGRWACSTPRRFWIFERGPSWKPRPRTRTATTRKRRRWHRLSCMDWLAGQLEGWHEEGARHNNPRPAGVIRPGSGTDVLLRFLRQAPGRWFFHSELVLALGRSKGEIDWALQYLVRECQVESRLTELPARKPVHRYRQREGSTT
ncbi:MULTISPECIES: hypothetical protein [unclassified Delftia]|uniref:hypothetical protein n=1 Tax=unclassified Delftia TaxID=2613839 RepID=UPI001F2C4BB2|nr:MULTISPECIES: hypothetical protein [unclassified Delftia]